MRVMSVILIGRERVGVRSPADLLGADNPTDILAHYSFDPFGNLTAVSGSAAEGNPFRFSTKYYDGEIGSYYFGYRDYRPDVGRWLSRDPFEEWAGMNVYAFCANYPIGYVDYDGRGYGPPLGGTHGGPAAGNAPPAETGLPPSTCSESEEGVIRNKPPFPGVPYFVDCECGKKKRCVDREKCTRWELTSGGVVQCTRFYWQPYDTVCTPCE